MGFSAPPPPLPPRKPDWHELMSARRATTPERQEPEPAPEPVERGDSIRDDLFEGLLLAVVVCVAIFVSLGWIR